MDRLRDLELVSSSPFRKGAISRVVMTPPPAMKCDWPACEWDTTQAGTCNSYADQRIALDLHLRMKHERRESEQTTKPLKGLKCEWEGCTWDTGDIYTSLSDQMSVMDLHIRVKHEGQRGIETKPVKVDPRMASKLDRPEIGEEMDEGDWAHFLFRWEQYKGGCSLDGDQVVYHLYSCMEGSVSKKVHQNTQGAKLTEEELLEMVKDMVVKKKNEIVLLTRFMRLNRKKGEVMSDWISRVKGEAELCIFEVMCECGCQQSLKYKDRMVASVLVAGINDGEWQEKLLQLESADLKILEAAIRKLEGSREARKDLEGTVSVAALTEYQASKGRELDTTVSGTNQVQQGAQQQATQNQQSVRVTPSDSSITCGSCGRVGHSEARYEERRDHCPAFGVDCYRCNKRGHFKKFCKSRVQAAPKASVSAFGVQFLEVVAEVAPISGGVPHHVWDYLERKWTPGNPELHGKIKLDVSLFDEGYTQTDINCPQNTVVICECDAVTDTGAMVVVAGEWFPTRLGVAIEDLFTPGLKITAANSELMKAVGAMFVTLKAVNKKTKEVRISHQTVYICRGVQELYLSRRACRELGVVSIDFPTVADPKTGRGSMVGVCGAVLQELTEEELANLEKKEGEKIVDVEKLTVPDLAEDVEEEMLGNDEQQKMPDLVIENSKDDGLPDGMVEMGPHGTQEAGEPVHSDVSGVCAPCGCLK